MIMVEWSILGNNNCNNINFITEVQVQMVNVHYSINIFVISQSIGKVDVQHGFPINDRRNPT